MVGCGVGTACDVIVNVKEEKDFLYFFRFSIWGPVTQTDKGQVSKRKTVIYTCDMHMPRMLKGMVTICGVYRPNGCMGGALGRNLGQNK